MCRDGTAAVCAAAIAAAASVSGDAGGFGCGQAFEENPGQHHPPISRFVGHRAARGRQLLARPAAKIALIRFQHAPPREKRLTES